MRASPTTAADSRSSSSSSDSGASDMLGLVEETPSQIACEVHGSQNTGPAVGREQGPSASDPDPSKKASASKSPSTPNM